MVTPPQRVLGLRFKVGGKIFPACRQVPKTSNLQPRICLTLRFYQSFDGWSNLIGSIHHVDSSLFKRFNLILR